MRPPLCTNRTPGPPTPTETRHGLRQKAAVTGGAGASPDEISTNLRLCIELGFGFDSAEMDQRLSDTFPAYGLYYAVNKQYNGAASKTPPPPSSPLSPSQSECDPPPPSEAPTPSSTLVTPPQLNSLI
ncbi:UNVERIFIED_CONTAM: hypothetical protein Sangu_1256500 [Sesamum angustifolium]|uniref:Uncharacterized protein n=1 Tax=Sesamum angustifolium TaxID=2727405 RepID=A0AAW2NM93_9LAMI